MTGNWVIALLACPAVGLAAVVLAPHAYAKWSARSLARRCRRAKALVLTYDDGPGGVLTPSLLELLRRHRVRATFFSLGMRACRQPGVLDRLKAEGHELGCHGQRHCHAWKVRPRAAMSDIEEGYATLSRWLPADSMFRPPHGKITLFTWLAVLRRNARLVWWSHDSGDTWPGALPAVEKVVEGVIRSGGGVVLLHDFDREESGRHHPRHEFVLTVTQRLIERAEQADLRIMTLGELFNFGKTPPALEAADF